MPAGRITITRCSIEPRRCGRAGASEGKSAVAKQQIDPQIPYVQVKATAVVGATSLAPLLGVSFQHAFGALTLFWIQLADRRLLARFLASGRLVLTDEVCRQRLALAFGREVDPGLFVQAGFLEEASGGWRVRGASRLLNVESARLRKSGATPVEPHQNDAITSIEGVPPGSHPGSDPTEERGERKEEREDLFGAKPAPTPRKLSRWESLFAELQEVRLEKLGEGEPEAVPPAQLNAQFRRLVFPPGVESREAEDTYLFALWCIYLENTWARGLTPAFPLAPFVTEVMQRKLRARFDSGVTGEWR